MKLFIGLHVFLYFKLGSSDDATSEAPVETSQSVIIQELSWPLKLMMWKSMLTQQSSTAFATQKVTTEVVDDTRRVGIQALELAPEEAPPGAEAPTGEARRQELRGKESEDDNMKMKLFRLMYETVRDSDLKVKRAELIKQHYENTSSFEVGYLMGDVSDKFNIMTDITMTLKRLYNEWKPIEHINAYEQVANQAIEISHIIDMVKSVVKNQHPSSTTAPPPPPPPPTKTTTHATTRTTTRATTKINASVFYY